MWHTIKSLPRMMPTAVVREELVSETIEFDLKLARRSSLEGSDRVECFAPGDTNETIFPIRDIGVKREGLTPGSAGTGSGRAAASSEERTMRQDAIHARQALPVRRVIASPAPLPYHPLPRVPRRSRVVRALLWLYRKLLIEPVGHRAREERLGALPERILRDIGLRRAAVHAAAWGLLRITDLLQPYPSAGPLCVCGRPGFRPTLVRLSEAA
jgi:hypothetical protein